MSNKEKTLDITSFDAVAEAEKGYDLHLKNPDGADTGVILVVLGAHSNEVMAHTTNKTNKMLREYEMAKKRGKDVELSAEKLLEQAREDALVRVTGWKNVTQEFTKDLLKNALIRNPHWLNQIVEASEDAANFTKGS